MFLSNFFFVCKNLLKIQFQNFTHFTDEQTGHHCMKAFKEEVSWFEANNRCLLAAGGHLVSIHSSEFDQRVNMYSLVKYHFFKYFCQTLF
jgi:hypothetical protein